MEVTYLGGSVYKLARAYLAMNAHTGLEPILREKIPELNRYGQNAGSLLKHIAKNIMRACPEYTPSLFRDVFQCILMEEIA